MDTLQSFIRSGVSYPRVPHPSVLIVGGGFSGTALAVQLLRLPHAQPLRIALVERAKLARGVAYGSGTTSYLLNVPAGRMSASSAEPLEFLSFARRTLPNATAEDFLPRELYGEYLESTLLSAAQAAPPHVRLERVRGEVVGIERVPRSALFRAHLANGFELRAASVVLATGNPAPGVLPGGEGLPGTRYVADPWQAPVMFRAGETVLAAGTGLTMADIVLAGQEAAQGRATVHAISRHGLLPAPQADLQLSEVACDGDVLLREASVSLRRLVRAVRGLAEDLELRGGDWRAAVASVRAVAPLLWQRLNTHERRRFLRHVHSYWAVHRHRLPHSAWSALNELRRGGHLHIHAGRVISIQTAGKRLCVIWRARGAHGTTATLVDRVVNCTGPQYDPRRTRERLLRSLLAQGMAVPDALGLGLETDESGALIDSGGRSVDNLYYLGPMLRPRHWETTAVQELRRHAEQLAARIARPYGAGWLRRPAEGTSPARELTG